MINLRYFCFVVIQLYLKVRALALFYFINLHHYTYITNCQNKIHRNSVIHSHPDVSKSSIHRKSKFSSNPDVFQLISRDATYYLSQPIPAQADKTNKIHRNPTIYSNPDVFQLISREYTCSSSKSTPAQAGLTSISCEYTRFLRIYFTQSYNNNITFLSEDRSQQLRQHHMVDVAVDGVV